MGFFSDFTGASARKDVNAANSKANAALDKGYNASQGYYDEAASSFDPYVDQGGKASTFYGNALGLYGDEARAAAQGTIASDPMWSGKLALDSNNVLKNLNARGMGASGAAALAGQRVLTENYGNWLDRYANLGRQGFEATGQKAGVRTGQGDAAYGYGATKANQAIQYGNAMAGTRNVGMNNLIGILGAGVSGYNALYNKGGPAK